MIANPYNLFSELKNQKAKLFIIGLPGAGKTTFGRKLAEKIYKPFFDLDEEIERHENSKISKIFKYKGEDYFRSIEADVLRQISADNDTFVLATGGGTPCFHGNMSFMNEEGETIFLDLPISEILERLTYDKFIQRPLFNQYKDLRLELENLYMKRISFYQKAQLTLKNKDLIS